VRPLTDHRLVVFGPEHLLVLGIFALGCLGIVVAGLRLRDRPAAERRVRRIAGIIVILVCGPFEVADWLGAVGHWSTSLPIQICDFAWLVAGVALLTGSRAWSALIYYWGLTLSIQGVLTPDLGHMFPDGQFFGYGVRHLAPPWTAVYLVAKGVGPSWRDYRLVIAVTVAVAGLAMVLNRVLGSNYDYLNRKPVTHSLLDLLGPWPWYVLVELALVAGGWALMTWPWNRRPQPRHRPRTPVHKHWTGPAESRG
jgi:hypothetical integral membrane protein (TIGR02206 family)